MLLYAIFRTLYYPAASMHIFVFSNLKPEKDPTLPSSYRTISILNTIGELFEKILLSRILIEVITAQ